MLEMKSVEAMCNRIIRNTKRFIPLIVDMELTYRCPSNCIHCFQKNVKGHPDIDKQVLLRTIDKLCEMGTLEFKISGGDPLIRNDIFDILEHLSKMNARVVLYTSGYFLNEEICNRLSDLRVSRVETTLLGTKPSTHDRLTNCVGSFERICNGILTLKKLGVDQYVKYMHMQQNFDDRHDIAKLSKKLGIEIAPSPYLWCKHGDPESTIEICKLTDSQLIEHFRMYPQPPIKRSFLSCGAGKYMLNISADGNVTPCASFTSQYTVGNIYNSPIEDIWNNAELLLQLRRNIRYMVGKCRKCRISEFCRMCPAIASWGGKSIKEPYEPMCHYAQVAERAYRGGVHCNEILFE